jgi:hypothetical protein
VKSEKDKKRTPVTPHRWSAAEDAELIRLRRQGMKSDDIATVMNKTERAVAQRYLKLVPTSANHRKGRKNELYLPLSERQTVQLLAVVARKKAAFWNDIAKEVGPEVTGGQCEAAWTQAIADRK